MKASYIVILTPVRFGGFRKRTFDQGLQRTRGVVFAFVKLEKQIEGMRVKKLNNEGGDSYNREYEYGMIVVMIG